MEPLTSANSPFQGGFAELLQAAQEQLAKSQPPSPKSLGKRKAVLHSHPFSSSGHSFVMPPRHISSDQGAPYSFEENAASSSSACPPWSDWLCCDADHRRIPEPCSAVDSCTDCPATGALPCHGSSHCSADAAGPCSPSSCCDSVACSIPPGQPCDDSCSPASACHDPAHGTICTVPAVACCEKEDCGQEGSTCTVEHGQCTSICPDASHASVKGTTKASDCTACNLPLRSGHNRLYSSFQELLDCCCCCTSPPVDADCCATSDAARGAGSLAPPYHAHGLVDASQQPSERSISTDEELIRRDHQHWLQGASTSDLPTSQRTSFSTTASERSRASTVSSATASTAPIEVSTPRSQHQYAGGHLFAKHGSPQHPMTAPASRAASPQLHALMNSTLGTSTAASYPGADKAVSGDCHFSQPHPHSENGGCLPPSWTLCDSTDCSAQGPHSHWSTMLASKDKFAHSPAFSDLRVNSSSPASTIDGRPQMCRWGGCNERFWTVEELVAHVNHSHLAKKHVQEGTPDDHAYSLTAPALSSNSEQLFPSPTQPASHSTIPCMWNDCNSVPWSEGDVQLDVISTMLKDAGASWAPGAVQLNDKTSAAMLQHLLTEHLGPTTHLSSRAGDKHSDLGKRKRFQDTPSAMTAAEERKPIGHHPKQSHIQRSSFSEEDCGCENVQVDQDGRKGHVCGWEGCSAIFPDHQSLTEHITNDHVGSGKAVYECRWVGCERFAEGKKFAQKQKVLRHIQTHTGDRPHKCDVCGRRFSEPNTLAQHMRTHTQEKPYVCDYPGCGKSFSVAGSLTIHKRVHSGAKPFKCKFPGCGKAFAESSNLTKHARIHSGERPFECPECGKRFSRPDQVSRHRKTHERKRAKMADTATSCQPNGQVASSDDDL